MGIALLLLLLAPVSAQPGDWTYYGGDAGGQRYSPLKQIDSKNVSHLIPAWTYHTGDIYDEKGRRGSAFEATPLYVEGTLYFSTPFGKVIALDPVKGTSKWIFDAKVNPRAGWGDFASRGVSTWVDSRKQPGDACRRSIFFAALDAVLYSLDASTGKPCSSFAIVDLRKGLRNPPLEFSEYEETSPPAVIGDLVIVGSGIADNQQTDQASGEVRAYDARTGALRWTFDPVPQSPSDPAHKTWIGPKAHRTGGANTWSVIVSDPAHDLVFLPTGSAAPDYYGGERLGENRHANSLVALKASTGKVAWSFQTVHHDLWDYDVASPPLLLTVKGRPAVAVASKTGNLFVLDRLSGKPLLPVEERPVPKSDVAGEQSWPTQPFSKISLTPPKFDVTNLWAASDKDKAACSAMISTLRNEGPFTPPSLEGSLVYPGNIGGFAWGGMAYDPTLGLLVAPANHLAAIVKLIPRDRVAAFRQSIKADEDWEIAPQRGTPYAMARRFLRAPGGAPCGLPPFGTLNAFDPATGAKKWSVPFGSMFGLPESLGSINLGGPLTTAGGLTFIGASLDPAIRAFSTQSGKELWRGTLPNGARSTPMTFRAANGKQYVIIAASGHGIEGMKVGDALVAFALPD